MKRMFAATLLAAALTAVPALAQQTSGQKMSAQEFFKEAANGGAAEVAMGKMATDQAQSPQVRSYGERLVNDHAKANAQLMEVGKKMNMSMPIGLDPKHQQVMDKLQKEKGPAFDREFLKHAVDDHKKDVAAFQSYAQSGDNADLKTFAQQNVPILQEHLRMAQDLQQGSEKAEAPGAKKSGSGDTAR